jgi:hypothetical protein
MGLSTRRLLATVAAETGEEPAHHPRNVLPHLKTAASEETVLAAARSSKFGGTGEQAINTGRGGHTPCHATEIRSGAERPLAAILLIKMAEER